MKFAMQEFVEQLFHIEQIPTQWVWTRSGNGEPDFEVRTDYAQDWVARTAMQCKPGVSYQVSMQLVDQAGAPMGAKATSTIAVPGVTVKIPTSIHLTL